MFLRSLFVVVVLTSSAAGLLGQTYKIDIKQYGDEGKTVEVKETQYSKQVVKVSFGGMVVKDQTQEKKIDTEFTVVVTEKGEDRPNKYKRTYSKALQTSGNAKTELSYQNRTILYELQDGKYTVTPKGDEALIASDQDNLVKEANNVMSMAWKKILLSEKEVKVGETWKLDPVKFAKSALGELPVDANHSSATGKLAKVYKKGKSQFGVLEFDIKIAVSKLGKLPLKKPAIFHLKMSVDTAIDGSSTAVVLQGEGNLDARTTVVQGGQNFLIELSTSIKGKEVHSVEK